MLSFCRPKLAVCSLKLVGRSGGPAVSRFGDQIVGWCFVFCVL